VSRFKGRDFGKEPFTFWLRTSVGHYLSLSLFPSSKLTRVKDTPQQTTMLILLQLINVLLLTSIGSTDAEKLFHSRDHSDLQIPSSHQAELITDQDTAEVNTFIFSLSPSNHYFN
jgi:hypothetical protein